jgi:hypothetical protein
MPILLNFLAFGALDTSPWLSLVFAVASIAAVYWPIKALVLLRKSEWPGDYIF